MADYTLPPLPSVLAWFSARVLWEHETAAIKEWGQQCADAARAPLLAGIAELEKSLKDMEAQLAQAQADAKRYRWLRTGYVTSIKRGEWFLGTSELLDQKIDAAMKEGGDA